ncbi:unnamed protein product [Amoebophrya sp. A120]|nr:unnamed protein product [Amoebophrya sp. A120]|eukprot:GSA120T00009995001.1
MKTTDNEREWISLRGSLPASDKAALTEIRQVILDWQTFLVDDLCPLPTKIHPSKEALQAILHLVLRVKQGEEERSTNGDAQLLLSDQEVVVGKIKPLLSTPADHSSTLYPTFASNKEDLYPGGAGAAPATAEFISSATAEVRLLETILQKRAKQLQSPGKSQRDLLKHIIDNMQGEARTRFLWSQRGVFEQTPLDVFLQCEFLAAEDFLKQNSSLLSVLFRLEDQHREQLLKRFPASRPPPLALRVRPERVVIRRVATFFKEHVLRPMLISFETVLMTAYGNFGHPNHQASMEQRRQMVQHQLHYHRLQRRRMFLEELKSDEERIEVMLQFAKLLKGSSHAGGGPRESGNNEWLFQRGESCLGTAELPQWYPKSSHYLKMLYDLFFLVDGSDYSPAFMLYDCKSISGAQQEQRQPPPLSSVGFVLHQILENAYQASEKFVRNELRLKGIGASMPGTTIQVAEMVNQHERAVNGTTQVADFACAGTSSTTSTPAPATTSAATSTTTCPGFYQSAAASAVMPVVPGNVNAYPSAAGPCSPPSSDQLFPLSNAPQAIGARMQQNLTNAELGLPSFLAGPVTAEAANNHALQPPTPTPPPAFPCPQQFPSAMNQTILFQDGEIYPRICGKNTIYTKDILIYHNQLQHFRNRFHALQYDLLDLAEQTDGFTKVVVSSCCQEDSSNSGPFINYSDSRTATPDGRDVPGTTAAGKIMSAGTTGGGGRVDHAAPGAGGAAGNYTNAGNSVPPQLFDDKKVTLIVDRNPPVGGGAGAAPGMSTSTPRPPHEKQLEHLQGAAQVPNQNTNSASSATPQAEAQTMTAATPVQHNTGPSGTTSTANNKKNSSVDIIPDPAQARLEAKYGPVVEAVQHYALIWCDVATKSPETGKYQLSSYHGFLPKKIATRTGNDGNIMDQTGKKSTSKLPSAPPQLLPASTTKDQYQQATERGTMMPFSHRLQTHVSGTPHDLQMTHVRKQIELAFPDQEFSEHCFFTEPGSHYNRMDKFADFATSGSMDWCKQTSVAALETVAGKQEYCKSLHEQGIHLLGGDLPLQCSVELILKDHFVANAADMHWLLFCKSDDRGNGKMRRNIEC